MDTQSAADATATRDGTTIERTSHQELVVTRTIDGPREAVFEAWTDAELFKQWWVPKSFGVSLLSCEIDARVGGGYRLTFDTGTDEPMAFFGRYLEVIPPSRLVWTNEEADGSTVITTANFTDDEGRTRVVIHDRYPRRRPWTRRSHPRRRAGIPRRSTSLTSCSSRWGGARATRQRRADAGRRRDRCPPQRAHSEQTAATPACAAVRWLTSHLPRSGQG